MSTNWGYVCESHDPPIESEHWLNHGDDALIDLFIKVRGGAWPVVTEASGIRLWMAWEGEPYPMWWESGNREAIPVPPVPASESDWKRWEGPPAWLFAHPRCKVALCNEYGDRRAMGETVPGSVAPPAVNP